MTVRMVLADDHAVVRDGLKMILESQGNLVVGEARDGREAIERTELLKPDVVIMDIAMPELNGIEAAKTISRSSQAKVIILSMHHTSEHLYRAMQAGVHGYLLKESAGAEVAKAVHAVMMGRRYFGKGIEIPPEKCCTEGAKIHKSPLATLSPREREVFHLVVEGKTSAEIAENFKISSKSVDTYRSRLMSKLGISNLPSLVKFALIHGITPAE